MLLAFNKGPGIDNEPDLRMEHEPSLASDTPSPAKFGTGATMEGSDKTNDKPFDTGVSDGFDSWHQLAANETLDASPIVPRI